MELLRLGLSNKQIATELGIRPDTARRHASRIKQKTKVSSSTALPSFGLVDAPDWVSKLDLCGLLSPSEIRVVSFLCSGDSSKLIARKLGISPRTVDKHRENILRKFRFRSARQLAAWLVSQYVKCGME